MCSVVGWGGIGGSIERHGWKQVTWNAVRHEKDAIAESSKAVRSA